MAWPLMEVPWIQDRRGQGQTRSSPDLLQVNRKLREKPEKDGTSPRPWLSLGMGGAHSLCASLSHAVPTSSRPSQPLCAQNPAAPLAGLGVHL